MFNRLRRISKDSACSLATSTPPTNARDHALSNAKTTTFYDLPPELRIKIYELVARETKLSLFLISPTPKPPSLLFVSRQTRAEYRPILLSLSPVQARIQNYDFRPLIRLVGSLYSTELKALRANSNLTISLHLADLEITKRDQLSLLRRWAVKRAEHLDRLQWSYRLVVGQSGKILYPATEERLRKLGRSIVAVRGLQSAIHESLAAELQPVSDVLLARYGEWQAAKTRV